MRGEMRHADAMRGRDAHFSPQDHKSSPLGRMAHDGWITRAEYEAGDRWRETYIGYLKTIGAPEPYGCDDEAINAIPDDVCEDLARKYRAGVKILEACGKRVLHAVNAIAVYGEPDELADYEYTARTAKIGFAALAKG